ncbi:hypothetical protein Pla110_22820 [Polystyrenella longa]|uniref:Uncharacterized protein n=1 Tax=Polystyrenella longa TaxID=2528007 RepID=A0A518CMV0_9PLAN|nr:hypothetical protein [Polystyrenella longa]QDU80551.1 hypothetical protein Pla110_22820 [Polystyrenella longa]
MTDLSETLVDARQLLNQKFYYQSLRKVDNALNDDPDAAPLWELRGLIHRGLTNLSGALSSIETAMTLAPLSSEGSCLLAECYVALDKPDLAYQVADNLWKKKGLDNSSRLSLAAIFNQLGFVNRAVLLCRKAICHDPAESQAYYDLSVFLGRGGHPLHIVESVARRAIDLDPENVYFRVGLAATLHRAHRSRRAYELIQSFGQSEIRQIRCGCCLKQIIEIFEQTGDFENVQTCEEQLNHLNGIDHNRKEND